MGRWMERTRKREHQFAYKRHTDLLSAPGRSVCRHWGAPSAPKLARSKQGGDQEYPYVIIRKNKLADGGKEGAKGCIKATYRSAPRAGQAGISPLGRPKRPKTREKQTGRRPRAPQAPQNSPEANRAATRNPKTRQKQTGRRPRTPLSRHKGA